MRCEIIVHMRIDSRQIQNTDMNNNVVLPWQLCMAQTCPPEPSQNEVLLKECINAITSAGGVTINGSASLVTALQRALEILGKFLQQIQSQ